MLWRGGIKKTRMSWTARRKAEWLQHRWDILGTPGRLYTATVEPHWLLAYFGRRGESEYVIDPNGLRIKGVPASEPMDVADE